MPPTRQRQEPPRPVQTQFPEGSILATSVSVSQLQQRYAKVCIYGRNRSGKTTLAAQFPKPVLLISSEPDANGGADSVTDIEGVYLQRVSDKLLGQTERGEWVPATDRACVRRDSVKGRAKVVGIANELAEKNPFATVVFDTVTSLQDLVLVELMGLPKVPDMMRWGMVPDGMYQQRAEVLRETVRPLLDIRNSHVVILAQEKDHNPSRGDDERGGRSKLLGTLQEGSFFAPALGSTNAGWLQDNSGYLFQMYEDEVMQEIMVPQMNPEGGTLPPIAQKVGTGKRQRHLRLLYHPKFAAGGRCPFSRNVPEFVTAPTPQELYKAMAQYIPCLNVK